MSDADARSVVLARVRDALGADRRDAAVPRDYVTESPPGLDVVERFAERVADYRATVHSVGEGQLPATIAAALAAHGTRRVVRPPGLPDDWLRDVGCEVAVDEPPLAHADLDAIDSVVTGCAVAIAETGTIVLDAGPGQGRRALSLLPDHHVCVVRASQIVGDVPEGLRMLEPRRPLTWISGPSATSDIELQRVEGVHGPRNLEVVIVADDGQGAIPQALLDAPEDPPTA